jgi:bla regulator protein blaR1
MGATTMKKFDRRIKTHGNPLLRAAGLMTISVVFAFGLAHGTPNSAQAARHNSTTNPPAYEFDVATFKPSQNTDQLSQRDKDVIALVGMRFNEDSLRTKNTQLRLLIQWAYGLLGRVDDMVSGGPKWLDSDRYDVTAKMDSSVADQLKKLRPDERELAQQQMVQALLADRLKLVFHRETKVFPVYALTIAKGGSKLHQAKSGDTYDKATFPYADKFADSDAKAGQMFRVGGRDPDGHMTMTEYGFGISMPALARQLYFEAGLIVQDKTGLTGKYDFTLKYAMIPMSGTPSTGAPDGQAVPIPSDPSVVPSIFGAIQQQLGLKLELTKGPLSIVVIDHVERPSGN